MGSITHIVVAVPIDEADPSLLRFGRVLPERLVDPRGRALRGNVLCVVRIAILIRILSSAEALDEDIRIDTNEIKEEKNNWTDRCARAILS
jgi:hypothetical protein